MSDTEFDVVIAAYLIPDLAQQDFDSLVALVADKRLEVEGVALVTVDAGGEVAVNETGDHLGRKGVKLGGGVGLVVGGAKQLKAALAEAQEGKAAEPGALICGGVCLVDRDAGVPPRVVVWATDPRHVEPVNRDHVAARGTNGHDILERPAEPSA